MAQVTEVGKIRRKVFAEIAKLTYEGTLSEKVDEIIQTVVTEDGPRYRCCVHKERAVLADRIKIALSQPQDVDLHEAAKHALAGEMADLPIVNVMPEACDGCPIDKFIVTDACRNCVAHNCINSCPKNAIMVVQNRAYIDKTKCVECGMCKRSCQYGAIIEISRPCERACDIKAIKAGHDRKAVIDSEKCVSCGACKIACPFGAISDRSMIVQVIEKMKTHKVVAMLAPAFIGQFGPKVRTGQVIEAMKQLGFAEVYEASFGADIVAIEETKEFLAVKDEQPFLTTSCCPAFAGMVKKHMPDIASNVSTTVSPMVATGRVIKHAEPDTMVVFMGPCIAKKGEGLANSEYIDFVLTFEEAAAMMVGKGINVAEMTDSEYVSMASRDGNVFARAGGVMQAVLGTVGELAPETEVKGQRSEGLGECKMTLLKMKTGKLEANFFEGMACLGGCVGGPGTLADLRVTTKLVDNYAATSPLKVSPENQKAVDEIEKSISFHHHHE
ncbi:MAG: 4Fe-4S dicluster domain-containing protein [Sporomusaceae bacterium]|nr:4Fe-4S dicluster domain-containing protein [Sporomusaceae bacterium]